jgi:hypothetical protein
VILEGRGGPTGTAVVHSAVAEDTPFPKGPPKSSVGGDAWLEPVVQRA